MVVSSQLIFLNYKGDIYLLEYLKYLNGTIKFQFFLRHFSRIIFLVKRICFPKFEGSRWCDDGAVDKIVDARVWKGEWWQLGVEELLVDCTEG